MSEQMDISPALWGRPPGSRPPGTRPPTGAWPPYPPGPPGPGLSGLFRLEQCWQDVAQAKVVLKKMIADIIAEDPTFIQGVGVAGVTNGEAAQPGQVGEFIELAQTISFTTAVGQSQIVSMGVLPPGDWDCWVWAYVAAPTTGVNVALNPIPAGFSSGLQAFHTITGGGQELIVLTSPTVRALTSVPSLIAMTVVTNQGGAPPAAGSFPLFFNARRMR